MAAGFQLGFMALTVDVIDRRGLRNECITSKSQRRLR